MSLIDIIRTGMSNLGRRKVRTVLTTIGVWVGILTIVTMLSAGIAMQDQVTATIRQLGLETVFAQPAVQTSAFGFGSPRPQVTKPITPDTLAALRALPGVTSLTVSLDVPDGMNFQLDWHGTPVELPILQESGTGILFGPPTEILAGHDLSGAPDEHALVLGEPYLRRLGLTTTEQQSAVIGQVLTLTVQAPRGDTLRLQVPVVGIQANVRGAALGPADRAQVLAWWYNAPDYLQTDGYSEVLLHTDSLTAASQVSAAVTGLGFRANTLQLFLDQISRIFTIIQVMLSSVGLLALLIASIGIANTMIMAIYERTREIGTLKALGASEGDVLRLFLVEAGIIGALGGILGVIGGWLLGLLLNWGAHVYLENQKVYIPGAFFELTPTLVIGALIFGTLVGLIAGIYPAARAGRLDPLVALRHE